MVSPSRTALVTGANRGIGLALARTLLNRGWSVIGTSRSPQRADDLAAAGARIEALDHTDGQSVSALADALGDTALDLLVLNAGVLAEDPLDALDPASVLQQLDSNALGPLRVVAALLPHLRRAADSGASPAVAALSSVMGSIERNREGGYYGYRASKAALNAIVRSLAQDLDLPVVAYHPGYVSTDMTRHQGQISPEESAGTLVDRFEEMGPEHSGRFFDRHGEELPW